MAAWNALFDQARAAFAQQRSFERAPAQQTQLRFHNANGIEWWVAVYLDGVLVLLADDCRLF